MLFYIVLLIATLVVIAGFMEIFSWFKILHVPGEYSIKRLPSWFCGLGVWRLPVALLAMFNVVNLAALYWTDALLFFVLNLDAFAFFFYSFREIYLFMKDVQVPKRKGSADLPSDQSQQ